MHVIVKDIMFDTNFTIWHSLFSVVETCLRTVASYDAESDSNLITASSKRIHLMKGMTFIAMK